MAIAKRVRQDNKMVQRGYTTEHVALITQIETDGKITDREVIDSGYQQTPRMVSVAQPDRVLLDLSLEEAQAIRLIVYTACGGSHPLRKQTDAVDNALRQANVRPAPWEFPYTTNRLNFNALKPRVWKADTVDGQKEPVSSGVGGLGPIVSPAILKDAAIDPTKGQAVSSGQAKQRDNELRAAKAQEVERAIRSAHRGMDIYW